MGSLFQELKRRNVVRVGVAYDPHLMRKENELFGGA